MKFSLYLKGWGGKWVRASNAFSALCLAYYMLGGTGVIVFSSLKAAIFAILLFTLTTGFTLVVDLVERREFFSADDRMKIYIRSAGILYGIAIIIFIILYTSLVVKK